MVSAAGLEPEVQRKLATLYRSHGHVVLRRARQILSSETDAEEVLQELFSGLAARPEQLEGVRNNAAWIYRATTHACLNRIRQHKNRARLRDEHLPPPNAGRDGGAEAIADVRKVIDELDEDCAAVLIYYHVDGMTHAEIAEVFGCSRRQVTNLLQRAIDQAEKRLRLVREATA